MTKIEFENLLAAYGRDPARWPETVRVSAQAFLTTHQAELGPALADAANLDDMLSQYVPAPPSDLLTARLLRSLPPQQIPQKSKTPGWHAIAAMVVAAFSLGFGGSQYFLAPGTPAGDGVSIATAETVDGAWLEAADDLGVSDVYNWVHGEDVVSVQNGI